MSLEALCTREDSTAVGDLPHLLPAYIQRRGKCQTAGMSATQLLRNRNRRLCRHYLPCDSMLQAPQ